MLFELCRDKHPEAWVFINQSTGSRYSRVGLSRIFNKVRDELGIKVTFNQATRHSVASNLLKDEAPIASVQKILGHKDVRTTMKYAHTDLEAQKVAFQKKGKLLHLSVKSPQNK